MLPFTTPAKHMARRAQDDMLAGLAQFIPGRTHVVKPTTDYQSYDSFSWLTNHFGYVYTSVASALADCTAGQGDAILLAPGLHTVSTSSLAMSKAGVKIFGPEYWMGLHVRQSKAILTTDITGDEIMNVTAPDCGIFGVSIRPITASDAIDLSAAANGFTLDGCHFDLYTPAVNASTVGITCAATRDVLIRHCNFVSDGAQGNAIVATGLIDSEIAECQFVAKAGTWASVILCGAATTELYIQRCAFLAGNATMSVGVNGTGATIASGVHVHDCRFADSVTVPIDNFNAGECEIAENYQAGVGSTDGGVLIVAIT